MNLEELLRTEGFETPEVLVTNTGESFQYFKHLPGVYEGYLGRLNIIYKNLDGEKCEPSTPGAKPAYGMLDIFIDSSPDGHSFFKKADPSYGESVFKQYVTLDPERQWQNKQLFSTFNLPNITVIENPNATDFKVNLKNLAFFVGRPVTFELVQSAKGNIFLRNLFLTDKTQLDEKKLTEALTQVKEWYTKLEQIKEKEQNKVKKDKDDKVLEGLKNAENIVSDAGLNPEDYE